MSLNGIMYCFRGMCSASNTLLNSSKRAIFRARVDSFRVGVDRVDRVRVCAFPRALQ